MVFSVAEQDDPYLTTNAVAAATAAVTAAMPPSS